MFGLFLGREAKSLKMGFPHFFLWANNTNQTRQNLIEFIGPTRVWIRKPWVLFFQKLQFFDFFYPTKPSDLLKTVVVSTQIFKNMGVEPPIPKFCLNSELHCDKTKSYDCINLSIYLWSLVCRLTQRITSFFCLHQAVLSKWAPLAMLSFFMVHTPLVAWHAF